LLAISAIKQGRGILAIWRTDAVAIVLFGLIGMMPVQYTYMAAINASNTATATVLQFTAPAMIFGATSSIEERRRPSVLTIVPAVIVAMALVMSAHHFDTYGDKVPHAFALMVWFAAPDLKYLIFGFLVGIRRPIWPKLIALPGLLATAAGIWWTLAVYHLNLQVILYAVTPLAFTYLAAATWFFPSRARQRRQPEQRLENA
jgi:hypothetical protein